MTEVTKKEVYQAWKAFDNALDVWMLNRTDETCRWAWDRYAEAAALEAKYAEQVEAIKQDNHERLQ